MTKLITPDSIRADRTAPDPFRFGWRDVRRPNADGTFESERVPLTAEDLLHPREGDVIPENTTHQQERDYLYDVFQVRVSDRTQTRVFSDCLIDWGLAGMKNHSPDVSVFDDVPDKERRWGIFPVKTQGARPLLAVEIVSPDRYDPDPRDNDVVKKKAHYHRVGVPIYIIVDQEDEDGPRNLIGFRHTSTGYVEMVPDAQGRLTIDFMNVKIGLRDERVVCYDASTGREIENYAALSKSHEAAQERIRQLEAELRLRNGKVQDPPQE